MEPDVFFIPYQRDPDEDRCYAAVGRALTFATRFEWNCRALAKIIAIRENLSILHAPTAEQSEFFARQEGSLAKQISKIIPKISVFPEVADQAVFDRARQARNDLAHEATVGLERELENTFARARVLSNLRDLTLAIAAADAWVCVAISLSNKDPLLADIAGYPELVAQWVVEGCA